MILKQALSFVIVVLSYYAAFSQKLDSLHQVARENRDSLQVQALHAIATTMRRVHVDSAVHYYDMAYRRAVLIGYTEGQLKALSGKGITYGMNDRYALAIEQFNRVLQLARQHHAPQHQMNSYNFLGVVHKRLGDYAQSFEYYNKALEVAQEHGLGYMSVYSNLAVIQDLMGNYTKAIAIYTQLIDHYDSLGDKPSAMSTIGNLAISYMNLNRLDTAITLMTRVLNYHSDQKGYGYFNNAANLAYMHYKAARYDSAIHYADLVIDSARSPSARHIVISSYDNKASALNKLGRYNEALLTAEKALSLADDMGFSLKRNIYHTLAQIHESLGTSAAALDYYKRYKAYSDSLYNEEKLTKYEAEEVKQEVFEKNQLLEQQASKMETLALQTDRDKYLRYLLITIAIALIGLISILYQRYRFKNRLNSTLTKKNALISQQKEQIEIINEQLESRMLRAQINPHFIFNALNSIQHFIMSDDKKKALRYLNRFSSLLRQVLENSINVKVPIQDELKFLEYYLELESLRFDDAFSYTINIDPRVDIHGQEIPVLLLQPFAENAILHGLLPKDGDKELVVSVCDNDDYIIYELKDNGIGREAAGRLKTMRTDREARGMSVTAQRIAMLTASGKSASVSINDLVAPDGAAMGTSVVIEIPKMI